MAIEIEEFDSPEEQKAAVDNSDYSDLLSGYKGAKVEEVKQEETAETETPVQEAELPPPDSNNWKGDNRFYQRGSKKGTLRDKPYIKATYNTAATQSIPASMLVNGALFLMVINFIIPGIIVSVNNWLSPKEKMTMKDLQLTKDEKKEIDPLMDATLKQLNIQANPLFLLILTLTFTYSNKFISKKFETPGDEKETKK